MKIHMYEAVEFRVLLDKIKTNAFSVKTSYKLSRLSNKILQELNFYDQKMREIILEFSQKDENNSPKFSENEQNILIIPEKIDECRKQIYELENLDIEVPNIKFKIEEFEGLALSMTELNPLMPFIEVE